MTIEEANHYINYCLEEGYHGSVDFEVMTDAEKIEWAGRTMAKADLAYDAWKEQNDNS